MKYTRIAAMAAAAAVILAAACTKDNTPATPGGEDNPTETPGGEDNTPGTNSGEDNPGNTEETPALKDILVGSWSIVAESVILEEVFNEDGSYKSISVFLIEEGTWSLEGEKITVEVTSGQERDWVRDPVHGGPVEDKDGNFSYTDWKEIEEFESRQEEYLIKFAAGNSVLLFFEEYSYPDPDNPDASYDDPSTLITETTFCNFLYRNGSAETGDISTIEGKWYWFFGEIEYKTVRTAVIVSGGRADLIITPWSERYSGAARYENGYLYIDNPTFYTCRYDDPENPEVWDHIDGFETAPENAPWRTFGQEDAVGSLGGSVRIPLVTDDGRLMYGTIASLMAIFEKQ